MPTIETWETALAIRDNTFFQVFVLSILTYLGYRLLIATVHTIWKALLIGAAVFGFLLLYGGSIANILLWNG